MSPTERPDLLNRLMGSSLAVLNRAAGSPLLDRLGLRRAAEHGVYQATRTGFRTAAVAGRTFSAATRLGSPQRPASSSPRGLFDLTPTDEQRMIQQISREFAADKLRPAAAEADTACEAPAGLVETAAEQLGIGGIGVPESLGGFGAERSCVTNALVAEALAHGDMGLALACLAPTAVSTALTLFGDAELQATYLPAFVSDHPPVAALGVLEPRPLFDPFALRTTARRSGTDLVVDGVKSLVPRAAAAELFVVGVQLDGAPALVLVESSTPGLEIAAEPSMGLRAAGLARLTLTGVTVPSSAVLANGEDYRAAIRLARLGWCALAVGTAQAVLDYVIPYVNDRVAFGEPISNRQAVAFGVADIAIELEGMRLSAWRAAALADRGRPVGREVALARALCVERGMAIGSSGVQLLGGHGFVKEHPVERWYRDLRSIGVMEGAVMI